MSENSIPQRDLELPETELAAEAEEIDGGAPGSAHPGGVNVCMGDGSVRFAMGDGSVRFVSEGVSVGSW